MHDRLLARGEPRDLVYVGIRASTSSRTGSFSSESAHHWPLPLDAPATQCEDPLQVERTPLDGDANLLDPLAPIWCSSAFAPNSALLGVAAKWHSNKVRESHQLGHCVLVDEAGVLESGKDNEARQNWRHGFCRFVTIQSSIFLTPKHPGGRRHLLSDTDKFKLISLKVAKFFVP